MGLLPGLTAAAALQPLHALTFGASHLGAMYMLAQRVPPGAAASAQSLYAALSAGFGSGLVMLVGRRALCRLWRAGLSVHGIAVGGRACRNLAAAASRAEPEAR